MNIDSLDFKHLQLLHALLEKHSISAAAKMLDIPQPTASHGLSRLRSALGDQLLVRARSGMEPTPKALAISGVVDQLLRLKHDLVAGGPDFTPENLEREFVIAGSDLGQLITLTALYQEAREIAPSTRFRALTLSGDEMAGALETGRADLAFGAYPSLVSGIHEQTLYHEYYLCFGAPDHPFIKQAKRADFEAADHIVVSTRGLAHAHRETEQALIDMLTPRRVRIITGSFLVALTATANSNLIMTAPAQVVLPLAKKLGLGSTPPPFKTPGFDVKQYWHARSKEDPAHQWLRQTVHRAVRRRFSLGH